MSLFLSYKLWLVEKKYSLNTVKSYLSELKLYFDFLTQLLEQKEPSTSDIFTASSLKSYLSLSLGKKTQKRTQAFLSSLCQFGFEQKYISQLVDISALKSSLQSTTLASPDFSSSFVSGFYHHLLSKKSDPKTIKSYLADVEAFITWIDQNGKS